MYPLVADLFLFCYDLIDAFNSTSRYLDDLLNINNIHFEHVVHRIYPAELQLNKAYASDTEAAFLDLNLSIHNDSSELGSGCILSTLKFKRSGKNLKIALIFFP